MVPEPRHVRSRTVLNVPASWPRRQRDGALMSTLWGLRFRGPQDQIDTSILQIVTSGIPLILGLGTRMYDPYIYVVFGAPKVAW